MHKFKYMVLCLLAISLIGCSGERDTETLLNNTYGDKYVKQSVSDLRFDLDLTWELTEDSGTSLKLTPKIDNDKETSSYIIVGNKDIDTTVRYDNEYLDLVKEEYTEVDSLGEPVIGYKNITGIDIATFTYEETDYSLIVYVPYIEGKFISVLTFDKGDMYSSDILDVTESILRTIELE